MRFRQGLLGGLLVLLLTACPGSGGTDAGGGIGGTVSLGPSITGQRLALDARPGPLRRVAAPRFVPGEVLVQLRGGVSLQSAGALSVRLAGGPVELQRVRALGLADTGLYRAALSEQQTLELLPALRARPDVAVAELNWLERPLAVPNDEFYPVQWHYPAINLPQAWDRTTGSSSVVVGVLDSGILFRQGNPAQSHPDLAGRVVGGYDMLSDPRNAEDGNGRDPDPFDASGGRPEIEYHGSHVAGTVGAASNNRIGVAGVSWAARLLPVRVCGALGCSIADQIDGILWAGGEAVPGVPANPNPAQVINMSLGGQGLCGSLRQQAVNRVSAKGVVIVVAAGNENDDASRYSPANCNNVIVVGATDIQNRRSFYSNYGPQVDVMAPGGDVRRDLNNDQFPDGVLSLGYSTQDRQFSYNFLQGTSMASPHVAGVVALMKTLRPGLTVAEAAQVLRGTARPLSSADCEAASSQDPNLPKGDDRPLAGADCGAGLIDADAALAALGGGAVAGFSLSTASPALSAQPGASLSVPLSIVRSGGFAGAVALSLAGAPDGVTGSFSPPSTTLSDSTLTLSVADGTPVGAYALTVRGSSGGTAATLSLSLTVGTPVAASVGGTEVLACLPAGDGCDQVRSRVVQITRGGASAAYLIDGLAPGDYLMLAAKDANNNGTLDEGDYLGIAVDGSGEPAAVRPGGRQADIEMVLLGGGIGSLPAGLRSALEQQLQQRR